MNHQCAIRITQILYLTILLTPFLPPVWLLAIGVMTLIFYKGSLNFKQFPEGILAAFFILTLVSWYFNPVWFNDLIPLGLIPLVLFFLFFLLTIWIKYIVNWSWEEIQNIYLQFWLGGFYIVVVVFFQQVNWELINGTPFGYILDFYSSFRWQSENPVRSVGTTGNSNLTAALLICFAQMSIYAVSVLKKRWQKALAFVAFIIYCLAIWSTGSRGAWVGLIIGLIAQLWMTGHRRRTVSFTLILLCFVSFFPQLIPRKETLASTLSARFHVWSNSWDIFQDNWLVGTLPLNFKQIFWEKTGMTIYHAHNIFLGVAAEFGLIGLILFLILIFVTVQRARRWRKVANKKAEKRLSGMLVAQTIALLGHGIYDYPIISPQIGSIFFLSIIIIHHQYERRCLARPFWSDVDSNQRLDWRSWIKRT